jgi:2-polyprenyl-3-methyl-5-hydroxy-6-metoxy-1,4-benzoquinol methylase
MITRWSAGIADQNMDEQILVRFASTVARHPWWWARARLAIDLLRRLSVLPPASVLEAGCGWGVNLALLDRAGYRVTGLDISRKSLEMLDHSGRTLIEADLCAGLPESVPQYEVVLALDVIEHIDDDQAVIGRLYQLTQPGGYVILSVPALPELYSEFDRIQGHRRRYTPESLRRAFSNSGFDLQDVIWWGQWLARPLARSRSRDRARGEESAMEIYRRHLSLPPWPAPRILDLMFRIDQRRTLARRNKTGTSLFAVARRPA